MRKVLITGASGFIGGHLVEEALQKGYSVWAGVRSSSRLDYLQDNRIQFIDLNFNDVETLKLQLMEVKSQIGGWNYIIHNLGATKVRKESDFERINFQFTKNFVEQLVDLEMVPNQFIFMSSLSVCGPFNENSNKPIDESYTPQPNTAYGKSKRKAELFLESLTDFPYLILRPTGVYGPREKDYFLMIKTIKSGFDVSVGFKPQFLSFIYVRDLCQVVFLAIDKNVKRRSYFISDGNIYVAEDFRSLVQEEMQLDRVFSIKLPLCFIKIVSILSEKIAFVFGKTSTLNQDKYKIIAQRNWNCDITPLIEELQFEPKFNLAKGLSESIQWYKQNGWI